MSDTMQTTPESRESRIELTSSAADSPLFREFSAELRRQAKEAVDAEASEAAEKLRTASSEIERKREETERLFETWKEQLATAQAEARERLDTHLAEQRLEIEAAVKSTSEKDLEKVRELTRALDLRAEALRAENEAVAESISRLAQMRLQAEVAETSRGARQAEPQEKSQDNSAMGEWKQRLASEMSIAQAQWNELLQSSLDSNMKRIASHLSAQSKEVLRDSEGKLAERFAELREPLAQISGEARHTVSSVKSALEDEILHARNSLADIEQSASRMREYSAQLEAANHDTLNELHRRLESILEEQTQEMNRRAERLAAELQGRAMPQLESLAHEFIERSVGEVESKLAPHFERVPELVRELAASEMQVEESLRLQRERLRQLAENNQREVASQQSATLAGLQGDFEAARKEALAKWTEELDTAGVRASHAAAENIGRASEWFQQEAGARLQVLVEQSLVGAKTSFDEQTVEATQRFASELEAQSAAHVGHIQEQVNSVAGEVAGRARTQLAEAAEAAANSFGQVLRDMSGQETEVFAIASRDILQARAGELEGIAEKTARDADSAAGTSLEHFRAELAAHLDTGVKEGAKTFAAEIQSVTAEYRAERDTLQNEWAANLDRLSGEAAERYQDRLESACDSWMVSSVRRLNEHGQNVTESLMRSADQALRESCSRLFEGLSEMLRGRDVIPGGVAGFASQASHETPDSPRASQ